MFRFVENIGVNWWVNMNEYDALLELRTLLDSQTVELGWDELPISFAELIRARIGSDLLNKIDEILG